MQGQLSQKERMLLEDLKSEEELCVTKYTSYASQAQDPQLNQLFNQLAGVEQQHYNTINQLLQSNGQSGGQQKQGGQSGQQGGQQGGQTWQTGQQGGQTWKPGQSAGGKQLNQSAQAAQQTQSASASIKLNSGGAANNTDKVLLQDMLSTEKYVSSAYDTSIFEAAQPTVRQALQHIQKEEQQHGEQIFQYMNSHGMYQVQ